MQLKKFPLLNQVSDNFWHDLLASMVVFLVALPLCMGVAIASGLPPAAGILTGVIGGLVIGCISGSPMQVSGPAAGLTVIVWELIREHGIEAIGLIILLAGALQLAAGVFRLGQWFRAVPPSVVNGMLSGIGILIFASQFHVMIDDAPKGNGLSNLLSIPSAVSKCLFPPDGYSHHIAGCVGMLTIVTIVLWECGMPKKLKIIPSALVAVVVATGISLWLDLPIKSVSIPQNLLDAVHLPALGNFHGWLDPNILLDAAAVAFIASAETLLCASAVDRMAKGTRTQYDRELAAQGVGNFLCGLVGALPMTGVIVRSSVNVQAGARTRASAILHGVWLLAFVVLLPSVLRLIPTSALAALLVFTGYKLMNFAVVKSLRKVGRSEVAIYFITMGVIVSTDLLTGVLTGVALSVLKLLYIFSHLEIKVETDPETTRTAMFLNGAATFLSLPRLAEALEGVPATGELHIHFEDLEYIDHACLELIMNWEAQHKATGGHLVIDWGRLGAMFRDRRKRPRQPGQKLEDTVSPQEPATTVGVNPHPAE